ncbi:RAB GTPase homolog G3A [Actinidia rufa]|uniref:RAB GTPase homolog G3A n=1 Tax=Actinidia rufa TaxID=165716 RepID=A0A7J0GGN8_9ERIC|nr:RAB GTPase homolog G3A [Actinidia rufa]
MAWSLRVEGSPRLHGPSLLKDSTLMSLRMRGALIKTGDTLESVHLAMIRSRHTSPWYDAQDLAWANPPDLKKFPFMLLGNKIDIDGGNSRVVSEKKAKEWCASKGNIPYFETSAKEDINVDAAFLSIAKTALANEREQDM